MAKNDSTVSTDQGTAAPIPPSIVTLQSTILTLDALSQEGFSEIATIANMALKLMEADHAFTCPEEIAQVLITIRNRAKDVENSINFEAEQVGCNYKDEAAERRSAARAGHYRQLTAPTPPEVVAGK